MPKPIKSAAVSKTTAALVSGEPDDFPCFATIGRSPDTERANDLGRNGPRFYSGDFATINPVESHGIDAPHELVNHEPQVLILDDVLVNTDPVRQDRILDVLGAQAVRLQILILTCHPDRYRGIGQTLNLNWREFPTSVLNESCRPQ